MNPKNGKPGIIIIKLNPDLRENPKVRVKKEGDNMDKKSLWGKGTLWGKEKGLSKSKPLMGKLVEKDEDLWGK